MLGLTSFPFTSKEVKPDIEVTLTFPAPNSYLRDILSNVLIYICNETLTSKKNEEGH